MLSGFVRIASLAAILALTSGVERAVWTSSDGVDLVYIAPSESIRVGPIAEEKVYITKKSKSFVRAGKIFVPLKDYLNTTNSEGLDTSRRGTSLKKQGNFGLFNPSWSRPSCCRRGVNMQTSTRFIDGSLRIGLVPCQWNYCQECEDSSTRTCYQLRNRCTRNGANSPFMIQNCPRTCGLCSSSFNIFDRFTTRNPFGPFPTPYGPPRNPYGPPQGPEPYRPPQVPGPYRPSQGPFPYRPPQTPYRPPPTPYRPPTTPYRPPPNPTLPQTSPQSPAVNVKVYSSRHTFPYVYKYTVESSYTYPYMTGRPGDVDSFHMYIRPHPHFTTPVYFCANLNHEAEYISYTPCGPGSSTKYTLYGSTSRSQYSEYLIMFTTDIGSSQQPNNNPVLSTRLSRSLEKCCGYEKLDAVLFVPDLSKSTQSPPPPQTPYYPPNTPYNPPQTPYYPPNTPYNPPQTPYYPPNTPYNPPQTPYVPPYQPPTPYVPIPPPINTPAPPLTTARLPSNTNNFNRACLDAHNYFRAMHNTPPLQWDTRLAASSAQWAQYLLDASERGPGQVKPGYSRTPNWPHSERKSRPDNAGENILWQINVGPALGDKSTLLWYNEIFDYNPSDPSRGRGGRPVGHYTQLLWKDTKKIGCSLRSKPLSQQQQSSFSSIASYVVAHYSPTGNVFSSGFGGPNFHAINVLPVKAGSCQSPSNCGGNSNCLGYSGMTCTCNNQRPVCSGSGSGGCVVHCERTGFAYSNFVSDCRGLNSCSCTDTGATCR